MSKSKITRRGMMGRVAAGVGTLAAASSGKLVDTASAQSSPKTFVLIHGALVDVLLQAS